PHRVGFGSQRFWKTDYGREIANLVDAASAELGEYIRCQPLNVSLDLKSGPHQVVVHSGAEQGLNPGDKLNLYQVVSRAVPGQYQVYRTHLVDSQTYLEVRELHESYSLATLHSELELHGRYVALSTTKPPVSE